MVQLSATSSTNIFLKLWDIKYLVLAYTNRKVLSIRMFGGLSWKQSVIFKCSVRFYFKLFSPWRTVLCPSVLGYYCQQTSPLPSKAFFRGWLFGFFVLVQFWGFICISTPLQIFYVERRLLGSQISKFLKKVITTCNNAFLKVCQTLRKRPTVQSPRWLVATELVRRAFCCFRGEASTLLTY